MDIIKELDIRQVGSRGYRFALFFCPVCCGEVEKVKKDGIKAKQCGMGCYSKSRTGVRRGKYLDFVIINNYRYRYAPDHPKAIGTKKLYVAEHRLVMECVVGRVLNDDEIVHHKNENTLDNSQENLELMTASSHTKLHAKKRKRGNNGKFTV